MKRLFIHFYELTIKKICYLFLSIIYKSIKIIPKSALFVSHPDFTDNTYPLFLELKKYDYKCTWILYKKESINLAIKLKVDYILFENIDSIHSILKFAKYHYLFTSHDIPNWIWKKGQIVYNCWHGSPFKKYRGCYLNNYRKQHYLITPSPYCLDLYCKTYERKIFRERCYSYRHFRTDYFLKNYGQEEKKKVIKFLKLDKYSKLIICCLTWMRDENSNINQSVNLLGLDLNSSHYETINNILNKNNILLVIKPHPAYEKLNNKMSLSNIKILSSSELVKQNIQLYCLLALSNALITDYSSILFDYCLLNNPVGHIMHNLNYYLNNEKEKFIYDDPTSLMYGYKIYNFEDLSNFITLKIKYNECLRIKIANLYNDDCGLMNSSTKNFIQDRLIK